VHDTLERPANACLTCPPPKQAPHWRLADSGYRTCSSCYDNLREILKEIAKRFGRLNPRPGAAGDDSGRGTPGFGSRPAANPHIIVMTDWRSKSCEVAADGVQYVWDPLADATLDPGQYGPPAGAYVARREVWYGADGRGHVEQERPPRSIPGALSSVAALIAEERDVVAPTTRRVADLIRWIDQQLDWLTRQQLVADVEAELRELAAQLRPVTGDQRSRIGTCPNTLDEGEHSRECGTRLYSPLRGDTIKCHACGREWPRPEWEDLGRLLQVAS
jgi:hypothetical protein